MTQPPVQTDTALHSDQDRDVHELPVCAKKRSPFLFLFVSIALHSDHADVLTQQQYAADNNVGSLWHVQSIASMLTNFALNRRDCSMTLRMTLIQAAERIPYETLLRKQQTASSKPAAPSSHRPSWSPLGSHPSPPAWQGTLHPRSSNNQPTLARDRVGQSEEEDWPDLTQLKWEGSATGVVRGQQNPPRVRDFVQNPASYPAYPEQDLDGRVRLHAKQYCGQKKTNNAAVGEHRLAQSVSIENRPRWGSPSALPSRPSGRAAARSLSRARQQPQGLNDAPGQTVQPLHTHISLHSLVASPKAAVAGHPRQFHTSLDELMADQIIQDQAESKAPIWQEDTDSRHSRSSPQGSQQAQNSHMATRVDSQRSSQHTQSQRHASQDWDLDSAKQGGEEESGVASAAARAMPSFASPTRSSEAKMKQRSLRVVPSKGRRRYSAGSSSVDADLFRTQSSHRHESGANALSAEAVEDSVSAEPLTSTFRSANVYNYSPWPMLITIMQITLSAVLGKVDQLASLFAATYVARFPTHMLTITKHRVLWCLASGCITLNSRISLTVKEQHELLGSTLQRSND